MGSWVTYGLGSSNQNLPGLQKELGWRMVDIEEDRVEAPVRNIGVKAGLRPLREGELEEVAVDELATGIRCEA